LHIIQSPIHLAVIWCNYWYQIQNAAVSVISQSSVCKFAVETLLDHRYVPHLYRYLCQQLEAMCSVVLLKHITAYLFFLWWLGIVTVLLDIFVVGHISCEAVNSVLYGEIDWPGIEIIKW